MKVNFLDLVIYLCTACIVVLGFFVVLSVQEKQFIEASVWCDEEFGEGNYSFVQTSQGLGNAWTCQKNDRLVFEYQTWTNLTTEEISYYNCLYFPENATFCEMNSMVCLIC